MYTNLAAKEKKKKPKTDVRVVEGQFAPEFADAGGGHQLLDGQVAEDVQQAVVGVRHETHELVRREGADRSAASGGRRGRSGGSASGGRRSRRRRRRRRGGDGRRRRAGAAHSFRTGPAGSQVSDHFFVRDVEVLVEFPPVCKPTWQQCKTQLRLGQRNGRSRPMQNLLLINFESTLTTNKTSTVSRSFHQRFLPASMNYSSGTFRPPWRVPRDIIPWLSGRLMLPPALPDVSSSEHALARLKRLARVDSNASETVTNARTARVVGNDNHTGNNK